MQNKFIPKDKFDHETVDVLKNADKESVLPYLEELFKWVEDMNWPIAQELVTILVKFEDEIIPYVKYFMNNPDGGRDYTAYLHIMPKLSHDQLMLIKEDLERVVNAPTEYEKQEEYDILAREYLDKLN
jgi:hypothetical protein